MTTDPAKRRGADRSRPGGTSDGADLRAGGGAGLRAGGLADELPDPYLIVEECRIAYANAAAERVFGRGHAALVGEPLRSVCDEADARRLADGVRDGEWTSIDRVHWRTAGGGALQLATRVRPFADGRHELLHVLLNELGSDGQRAAAFELLEQDVGRLQLLGRAGRYQLDVDPEREGWWSEGVYRILALDPQSPPLSRNAFTDRFVHPDDRAFVLAAVARAFERQEAFEVRYRILRADGELRYVRSVGEPLFARDGAFEGLRGVLVDVTDEARSRLALEEQGSWLTAILNTAVEGIILIDEQGSVLSANPAAERIFGWTSAELAGRNVRMLMPSPFREEHDDYLRNYARTGVPKIIGIGREVVGQRRDGSVFPMDLGVSEVRVGERRLFTGFVRDISERKRLEGEFLRVQKAEAVGRMSASIAHDFNNLLMGFRSCASLALADLAPDSEPARLVAEIERSSQRGIALTRRLLAFSRARPAELVPTRLSSVIADNELMLRQLLGEDIDLVVRGPESDDWVLADAGLIEQVLVNLAVNARDAMPGNGSVVIEVRLLPGAVGRDGEPATDGSVRLSVTDSGCGMSAETLARIFEPFFTTKDPGLGTGLGLSTVQRIVRELRGRIEVESTPGGGSAFHLTFPRCPRPVAPRTAQAPSGPERARGGETVLLVEDENLIRSAVRRYLTGLGYRVSAAESADEALEQARKLEEPLDLLVTDVVLPGLGGKELAERLQALNPGIATIFMSAHSSELLVEQGRLDPGVPYLEKPYDMDRLGELAREVLDARAAGRAGP